jgi:hypothetical protein
MSAVMSRPAADFYTSTEERNVDQLDAAIGRLVRQMNADSYRMLVLVREFDDRFGWKIMVIQDLRRVALLARGHLTVGRAREGAHGARAADAAGDLGGIRGGATVLQQGQSADARRARA